MKSSEQGIESNILVTEINRKKLGHFCQPGKSLGRLVFIERNFTHLQSNSCTITAIIYAKSFWRKSHCRTEKCADAYCVIAEERKITFSYGSRITRQAIRRQKRTIQIARSPINLALSLNAMYTVTRRKGWNR